MRRSILAEKSVLDGYGCSSEKIPVEVASSRPNEAHNCDHFIEVLIHPSGWKFHSFHRHILNERERKDLAANFRDQLRRQFASFTVDHPIPDEDDDDIHWDNFKLHIPPMLFGRDIMRFDFESRGSVNISAQDALFCWLCQHVPEVCEEHPLHVIQVPYAKKWASRLAATVGGTTVHHNLTPSHGITPIQEATKSVATTIHASAHHDQRNPSDHSSQVTVTEISNTTITAIRASDWTYSTDYCCTLTRSPQAAAVSTDAAAKLSDQQYIIHGKTFHRNNIYPLHHDNRQINPEATFASPWIVTPQSACGIDYDLLRRRDVPILFYDEMTLYEDDLEDCGEISVEAKVRVMPNCWFALVRCFLRIDQVIARCRETRLFHVFPTSADASNDITIHAEVLWREKSLEEDPSLFHAATLAHDKVMPPTSAVSPAASAVLRAAQGAPLPPALLATMQATNRVASSTTSASNLPYSHPLPSAAINLPQRYTKENAGEVLPRVNDTQDIPAYYTFTLRHDEKSSATDSEESHSSQSHGRHLHLFGLAAAHGIRK